MLARAKRDYYAVLGVPRDAGREEIKRAFRALAAEVHPDVSAEPDAAERFREIAEAYDVLSRPESRASYDRLGVVRHTAERRERATRRDTESSGPSRRRAGERGADVTVEIRLGHRDAARGTGRDVRFDSVDVCPHCLGIGRVVSRACDDCGGTGQARVERTVHIRVPPGAKDGETIRYPGEGQPGGTGAGAGDVIVVLRVEPVPDRPLVRRLAVGGVACAVGLAVVVAIVQ